MHNMVKTFGLEHGGDVRCIIMDTHRPLHLANVHSRHNVVVLNDMEPEEDKLSSGSEYSDNNDTSEQEEEDDEV